MLYRSKFATTFVMLIVIVNFAVISPANTKPLLKVSKIVYGPINPSAGQYADGISQQLNATDMSILDEGWLNFTYIGFVDDQLFNVTQKNVKPDTIYEFWLIVNITDRSVIDGTSWWVGTYYFGWVPSDIEVGDTVALGPGNGTVQAKEIITVNDTAYETWRLYGELSGSNTTSWYDVYTGHLVKTIQRDPNFEYQWFLVSSNIAAPYEAEEPVLPEIQTIGETVTELETPTETPTASEHGEAILAMAIILFFVLIKKKR